jgi:hypothetical protein
MNFYKMWRLLEDKDGKIVGSIDPTTIAKSWDRMSPGNPAQNLVDIGEVWRLVRAISNHPTNNIWIKIIQHGMSFNNSSGQLVQVYKNDLSKIVKIPNISGEIKGAITIDAQFYCLPDKVGDKISSEVMIAPPPCLYDNEERAMLSSIIIHELRHAMDFHEFKNTTHDLKYTIDKGTHYEIDMDLYARSVFEARAHADQVKILLTTLGDKERTKRVIQQSILARGFIPSLRESMIELVDMIGSLNENIDPPAIVAVDENKIEQAVELLRHICESFKLSRFVKMPG